MMRSSMRLAGYCGILALSLAASACGKSPPSTSAAPVGATAPGAAPAPAGTAAGNVTAQASESIATNTADPTCPTCQRADASSSSDVVIKPLDPVFRDDLKMTIGMTCQLLEDGVAILEGHVKDPASAQAALLAYREKNKTHIAEMTIKTRDMAVRLKELGFEADIPEEVKADYEDRMSKALARLEAVRTIYAKHPAVLEAFGPFIRSAE